MERRIICLRVQPPAVSEQSIAISAASPQPLVLQFLFPNLHVHSDTHLRETTRHRTV